MSQTTRPEDTMPGGPRGAAEAPIPSGASPPASTRSPSLAKAALLIFALALGFRLLFAGIVSDTYDYDEFVVLLLARDFAHGAVPYRDFIFFHPPGILVLLRLIQPL